MSRSVLLRLAATLVLITCVGHTVGTFMEVPPEQIAMHEALTIMKKTMIPMPVGAPRSYMQILDGNNLCTSLSLLVSGVLLLAVAGLPSGEAVQRVITVVGFGLAGMAVLSALYFFSVPAVFTALAAMLCLMARLAPR